MTVMGASWSQYARRSGATNFVLEWRRTVLIRR